jgi:hypothetical protein
VLKERVRRNVHLDPFAAPGNDLEHAVWHWWPHVVLDLCRENDQSGVSLASWARLSPALGMEATKPLVPLNFCKLNPT